MGWEDILKRWAYSANNVDEYLESVRQQIDSVLDGSFNQKVKEIKDEIASLDKERLDRWRNSMETDARYRFAPNRFEESHSMYEDLVSRFGHYAARRAAIPHEMIKEMARHEHDMEILSLFGLEEPKKYTVDMMKDWYVTGHYDEDA